MKQNKSRLRRGDAMVRRLIQRDKTPLAVLLMAAVVGTLAGAGGVAFERASAGCRTCASVPWCRWRITGSLTLAAGFYFICVAGDGGLFSGASFRAGGRGSGIPEIEGALEELRPVRWWRVLPVKFIGGMGTLGAGMVLGREGPTVQLGGNVGRMVLDIFRMRSPKRATRCWPPGPRRGSLRHLTRRWRDFIHYRRDAPAVSLHNLISIKAVFTGVIMSSIVFRIFNGESAIIEVGKLSDAPVNTLWLYLILGMIFGCVGPLFNSLALRTRDMFQRIHGGNTKKWVPRSAA